MAATLGGGLGSVTHRQGVVGWLPLWVVGSEFPGGQQGEGLERSPGERPGRLWGQLWQQADEMSRPGSAAAPLLEFDSVVTLCRLARG